MTGHLLVAALAAEIIRVPLPPPVIAPVGLRADEQPVKVETEVRVAESNALYRLVTTGIVFTNPNARQLAAEFEFPLPDGATVCGYRLEVKGEMVPGVVCEKEKARVAFENEQRKGADPGVVEQVKGNIWRTRIFPLPAKGTRKAEVSYVVADESVSAGVTAAERHGAFVYEGRTEADAGQVVSAVDRCRTFAEGWILWDASYSRKGKVAADLERLGALPEKGNWKLVVFRNVPSKARVFTTRAELLAAVSGEACDGGTDLAALLSAVPNDGTPKILFSDEQDTLNACAPQIDDRTDIACLSRPAAKARRITVTRRPAVADEKVVEGRLLATAWAANRIADLSVQAESRKDEFLALGREFGVASPVTSLIVFETLDQWLQHKVEPPKELSFHDEWVKRRAAEDDQIARKAAHAEFERRLLKLWNERVKWWKDPKPRIETRKSGLFDRLVGRGASMRSSASRSANSGSMAFAATESESLVEAAEEMPRSAPRMAARSEARAKKPMEKGEAPSATASVTLVAWDPKTPYLSALKAVAKEGAYAAYLKERETFGNSPAFYLDCAGWFFTNGMAELAKRILSTLAEFKLEDVALWRTMGWRLREAEAYDEAVAAFRRVKSMRGEEGQSYRDLALVLTERGKARKSVPDLTEALALFAQAAFEDHGRRAARRSNDIQVAVVALEELNGLISWCEAQTWGGEKPSVPKFDEAYRRDLPMDLRIILSWDADETDIDIHVLEPNGEEAFYGHRRTSQGGFVGEDVTTGYGPEEYLRKDADSGVYKVLSNYFASHQQALTGAAIVTATVYTNWARKDERRQTLTLRLDKPKDKHMIGEVKIEK